MNAFFEALTRASAFGLAALAVALLAQCLLGGRVPAAWRAWVWRAAVLQSVFALLPLAPIRWQVLAPPAKTAVAPLVAAAPPNTTASPIGIADESPASEASPELPAFPSQQQNQTATAPRVIVARTPPLKFDWRAAMLAIYALGLAFQCAQLARGAWQLRGVLRSCAPIEDARLLASLNRLSAKLGLHRAPRLLQSERSSPFLTGVLRPQIVLPRALCQGDKTQFDAVVAHELAHCKRRDLVWSALMWLGQTLLWFHPLAWVSRRFHALETECACDELALQLAPIAPQSYGALLLDSMNNLNFHSPLAAGTCDNLLALKARLLRLNRAPKKPRKMAKFAFALALLVSCGAVVPLKLVARAGDTFTVTQANAFTVTKAKTTTQPSATGSAVVQGVVISRQTKKPCEGIAMSLWSGKTSQQSVTNARGYFRFSAPSGQYSLVLSQQFPQGEFVLKSGQKREFKIELNEVDERYIGDRRPEIAKGAVIQGVVKSRQTKRGLAGVPVILVSGSPTRVSAQESFVSNGDKQLRINVKGTLPDRHIKEQIVTDALGYFRFRAMGGDHTLLIDGKVSVSTAKQTNFTAHQAILFNAKYGRRREFKPIQLDKVALNAPKTAATGTVVGPNGKPVANAIVQASTMSKSRGGSLLSVVCDKNGRFQLSAEMSKATVQLWADAGEWTTPQSTFVGAGGHVKLQMEKNAWLSASGRVTDEKRQPLRGAKVRAHFLLGNLMSVERIVKSDANGRFVFDRVRPGSKFFLTSTLAGYGAASYSANKNEKFADFALTMPSANTSLRGVVTDEKGQPAKSFPLFVRSEQYSTDAKGQFFLPHFVEGKNEITVMAPSNNVRWKPVEVSGGDQNVKIRLTTATRESGYGVATEYKPSLAQQKLFGKMAPPIQASYWAGNKATPLSSLRGKVVLLVFNGFDYNPNRAIADFARSFAGRVQVIGVLPDLKSRSQTRAQIDALAKQYSFPIALDSPPQNQLGRPTLAAYSSASYAVIGRDGKIVYAGDNLRNALQIASR